MERDNHSGRVIERAVKDISSIISRYRTGDLGFEKMVGDIEVQINSMIGFVDPAWLEEWRSHWNRLEYVNASMIDDDRSNLGSDEKEMVEDSLDALENMTRP